MNEADFLIRLSRSSQLVVGNWKMNMTIADARAYAEKFLPLMKASAGDSGESQQIILCPSFTVLCEARRLFEQSSLLFGAQDLYWEESGAYTGEVSAGMIKELASFVIIGHSERRIYRQETSGMVAKKMSRALAASLVPLLCVGEDRDTHEAGNSKQFIERQLRESLAGVELTDSMPLVIAYEPIWALSSSVGHADAPPAYVQEIAAFIRQIIGQLYNEAKALEVLILFGGNITPETAHSYIGEEISGLLVGSASTKPDQFFRILTNIKK